MNIQQGIANNELKLLKDYPSLRSIAGLVYIMLYGKSQLKNITYLTNGKGNKPMKWHKISSSLYRWTYIAAMYSGTRVLFNRIGNMLCRSDLLLSGLHDTELHTESNEGILFFVHRRPRPKSFSGKANFGMISLKQTHPKIHPLLHWYFCLTSHFGCGQTEIAFFEEHNKVKLYALRNTAASNVFRLGWADMARQLKLANRDDVVMRLVINHLEDKGIASVLASTSECVDLAVSNLLLSPGSREQTISAIKRRHSQLQKALKTTVV